MTRRWVILTSEFPPWSLGGVGRYLGEIAPRLRGGAVQVLLVPTYHRWPSPPRPSRAPVAGLGASRSEVAVHVAGDEYRDALGAVGAQLQFEGLARAADEVAAWCASRVGDVDDAVVVYVQDYSLAPVAAALARRWRGATLLAACHLPVYAGFTYFDKPIGDAVHQVLEARLVSLARRVVVPSAFAAHVLSLTHNAAGKLVVAPLGAARPYPVQPASSGATTRLLAVGRPTEQKGHHLLLDAFEQLVGRHARARLTIVCGALPPARLLDRVRGSPAAEVIDVVGDLAHDAMWRLYDQHDLLVTTSLYETFGLSVLEAMASARLTVGFATPALRELWGDELSAQIGVPVACTEALVERLDRLLRRPDRRTELAAALHRRSAAFSWSRHLELLEQAVDDQPNVAVEATPWP